MSNPSKPYPSNLRLPMLFSKIHRATVTAADLHYNGSLTIDEDLMDAANIVVFQKIEIYNITNGSRLETYAITGERGSGTIQANGAAAHHTTVGDLIIIAAYGELPANELTDWQPSIVLVDEANRPKMPLSI